MRDRERVSRDQQPAQLQPPLTTAATTAPNSNHRYNHRCNHRYNHRYNHRSNHRSSNHRSLLIKGFTLFLRLRLKIGEISVPAGNAVFCSSNTTNFSTFAEFSSKMIEFSPKMEKYRAKMKEFGPKLVFYQGSRLAKNLRFSTRAHDPTKTTTSPRSQSESLLLCDLLAKSRWIFPT